MSRANASEDAMTATSSHQEEQVDLPPLSCVSIPRADHLHNCPDTRVTTVTVLTRTDHVASGRNPFLPQPGMLRIQDEGQTFGTMRRAPDRAQHVVVSSKRPCSGLSTGNVAVMDDAACTPAAVPIATSRLDSAAADTRAMLA
jgi:hypothetical protein